MNVQAIMFDSDGTLIDTTKLITEGFKQVLIDFNYTELATDEIIKQHIGGHIPDVFSGLVGEDSSSDAVGKMTAHLDEVQNLLAPTTIASYPGELEMLLELKAKGIKVGLFTSGTVLQVKRNFNAVGIDYVQIFDAVVTYEDGLASKPSPDGLLSCMKKLQIDQQHTMFVGDHSIDICAGKNAKVGMTVGVSHGFQTVEELTVEGADKVILSLTEILELV